MEGSPHAVSAAKRATRLKREADRGDELVDRTAEMVQRCRQNVKRKRELRGCRRHVVARTAQDYSAIDALSRQSGLPRLAPASTTVRAPTARTTPTAATTSPAPTNKRAPNPATPAPVPFSDDTPTKDTPVLPTSELRQSILEILSEVLPELVANALQALQQAGSQDRSAR
ncbi:unnamed protein product [Phytophthora lilii]|uniref:Unnamed protein product n=1 Tax=Phytophthora lilii TaxID=2077276 RepID=A0A9W6TKY4_9STRA|nr:unnamed protein product [Phytophthora lilii]